MSISIDINDNSIKRPTFRRGLFDRQNKPKEVTAFPKATGNTEAKKVNWKKVFSIFFAVAILVGGAYAFRMYKFADSLGLKIGANDILNPIKKDPELKKDTTGKYTAVMFVGIDSRSAMDGLQNTDTIMVVSYNYETKDTIMVSIPRDFAVDIPENGRAYKINAVYHIGESQKKGEGLKKLQSVVKDVTGIETQYYAMVDLQGFRQAIDAVGGVVVNVENSFTDYCYPADETSKNSEMRRCGDAGVHLAETLNFTKGPQTMDGATALKYARSRKAVGIEGGDYARARRQQRVIAALRDKMMSSETFLNPQKLLDIMDAVQNNIKVSEFTTQDVQAGIGLVRKMSEDGGKTYSFVLDPSIGNSQVITDRGLPTYLGSTSGPKLGVGNNSEIRELVKLFLKQPALYSEKAIIYVYDNGIGYQNAYQETLKLQENFPYTNIRFMGTVGSQARTGNAVFDQTDATKPNTVRHLAKYFETEETQRPEYITTSLYGEDVTVLLGKIASPSEAEN